ncbi:hypothetical protein HAPAU_27160 [Halalkalicoccus paucihalophilus]|uniref:Uncharacterized protein n=1 Tax=Halalkalicoccus paucihalophilus TaxID=1008153 RepID=A0A151AC06_9EURY|nr:hypothetical protein [Halalkalicoccus paucihalophilus]KYH25133.1 hypothetical protein HAPAU_27160 [Halalkalicoccus paucihalophilus]
MRARARPARPRGGGLRARERRNARARGRFAVHQLFEGYTLFQFGPGSVLGALAVGYTISSLAPRTRSEADSAATAGDSGSDSTARTDAFGYGREVRYRTERHDERS